MRSGRAEGVPRVRFHAKVWGARTGHGGAGWPRCGGQLYAPRPQNRVLCRQRGSTPGWGGRAKVDPVLRRLEYCDEAVRDPSLAPPVDVHQPPAFLHKLLQLAGVCLRFEELPRQVGPP